MIILLDLDGTLIDISERYYRLFHHIVQDSRMAKEEYWNRRQSGETNHQILKSCSEMDIEEFDRKWMNCIEAKEYLKLDKPFPDIEWFYSSISMIHKPILLTARHSKGNLMWQLKSLGINDWFEAIIVAHESAAKLGELVRINECNHGELVIYITDTGADIRDGNEVGVTTIGITHGLHGKGTLLQYKPSYIVNSLEELAESIDTITT